MLTREVRPPPVDHERDEAEREHVTRPIKFAFAMLTLAALLDIVLRIQC